MATIVEYELRAKDNLSPIIEKTQKASSGLISTLKSIAPAIGVGTVIAGFGAAINTTRKFEKSISTLSSLTGKTGDDLKVLEDAAIRMGTTTTLSATEAAEAMTVIGSKRPELLASSEALAAVTEEAIILAEAAGIDMPSAATALTGALNQFGLSAENSRMVIDTLAGGSKAGAADIGFLNAAIEKAGATASSVGLSFQETVAAIETIAGKVPEATTAGLQLKNSFLELAAGEDKFNPAIVGMTAALDNLAAEGFGDVDKAAAKFGKQNAVGISTLIEQRGEFERYTEAVSVSGTALEQQGINVDNFDGSMKSLMSALEGVAITVGKALTPAIRFLADAVTGTLLFIKDNADVLLVLAGAIGIATIATKAAAIQMGIVTFATKLWTGAQALLNTVMALNPIALVVIAIAALTAAIVIAWRKSEAFRGAISGLWEAIKVIGDNIYSALIEPFMAFKDIFDGIIDLVTGNGFDKLFDGIKRLGSSFLTFLLQPLLQIAKVFDEFAGTNFADKLKNFTGMKDISEGVGDATAKGYAEGIADFQAETKKSANPFEGLANAGAGVKAGGTVAGALGSTTGTVAGEAQGASGTKMQNITINIQKLVETLNLNSTTVQGGAAKIKEEVSRALLTAVNDASIIAG
jgi:TP901 family phage tail tape measure protein